MNWYKIQKKMVATVCFVLLAAKAAADVDFSNLRENRVAYGCVVKLTEEMKMHLQPGKCGRPNPADEFVLDFGPDNFDFEQFWFDVAGRYIECSTVSDESRMPPWRPTYCVIEFPSVDGLEVVRDGRELTDYLTHE